MAKLIVQIPRSEPYTFGLTFELDDVHLNINTPSQIINEFISAEILPESIFLPRTNDGLTAIYGALNNNLEKVNVDLSLAQLGFKDGDTIRIVILGTA